MMNTIATAAMLAAPSRGVSIHPWRKAQTRPNAVPMKLYCPPERGIMALSSANVSAPPSVNTPATRYAGSTIHGVPTLHVMTRALTKTPVPMTLVTISAVAGMSVSPLQGIFSFHLTSANFGSIKTVISRKLSAIECRAGKFQISEKGTW